MRIVLCQYSILVFLSLVIASFPNFGASVALLDLGEENNGASLDSRVKAEVTSENNTNDSLIISESTGQTEDNNTGKEVVNLENENTIVSETENSVSNTDFSEVKQENSNINETSTNNKDQDDINKVIIQTDDEQISKESSSIVDDNAVDDSDLTIKVVDDNLSSNSKDEEVEVQDNQVDLNSELNSDSEASYENYDDHNYDHFKDFKFDYSINTDHSEHDQEITNTNQKDSNSEQQTPQNVQKDEDNHDNDNNQQEEDTEHAGTTSSSKDNNDIVSINNVECPSYIKVNNCLNYDKEYLVCDWQVASKKCQELMNYTLFYMKKSDQKRLTFTCKNKDLKALKDSESKSKKSKGSKSTSSDKTEDDSSDNEFELPDSMKNGDEKNSYKCYLGSYEASNTGTTFQFFVGSYLNEEPAKAPTDAAFVFEYEGHQNIIVTKSPEKLEYQLNSVGEVQLNWSPPDSLYYIYNSIDLIYKVEYRRKIPLMHKALSKYRNKKSPEDKWQTIEVPVGKRGELSTTVTGLTRGASFEFRVFARAEESSNIVWSNPSTIVSVNVKADIEKIPTEGTFKSQDGIKSPQVASKWPKTPEVVSFNEEEENKLGITSVVLFVLSGLFVAALLILCGYGVLNRHKIKSAIVSDIPRPEIRVRLGNEDRGLRGCSYISYDDRNGNDKGSPPNSGGLQLLHQAISNPTQAAVNLLSSGRIQPKINGRSSMLIKDGNRSTIAPIIGEQQWDTVTAPLVARHIASKDVRPKTSLVAQHSKSSIHTSGTYDSGSGYPGRNHSGGGVYPKSEMLHSSHDHGRNTIKSGSTFVNQSSCTIGQFHDNSSQFVHSRSGVSQSNHFGNNYGMNKQDSMNHLSTIPTASSAKHTQNQRITNSDTSFSSSYKHAMLFGNSFVNSGPGSQTYNQSTNNNVAQDNLIPNCSDHDGNINHNSTHHATIMTMQRTGGMSPLVMRNALEDLLERKNGMDGEFNFSGMTYLQNSSGYFGSNSSSSSAEVQVGSRKNSQEQELSSDEYTTYDQAKVLLRHQEKTIHAQTVTAQVTQFVNSDGYVENANIIMHNNRSQINQLSRSRVIEDDASSSDSPPTSSLDQSDDDVPYTPEHNILVSSNSASLSSLDNEARNLESLHLSPENKHNQSSTDSLQIEKPTMPKRVQNKRKQKYSNKPKSTSQSLHSEQPSRLPSGNSTSSISMSRTESHGVRQSIASMDSGYDQDQTVPRQSPTLQSSHISDTRLSSDNILSSSHDSQISDEDGSSDNHLNNDDENCSDAADTVRPLYIPNSGSTVLRGHRSFRRNRNSTANLQGSAQSAKSCWSLLASGVPGKVNSGGHAISQTIPAVIASANISRQASCGQSWASSSHLESTGYILNECLLNYGQTWLSNN